MTRGSTLGEVRTLQDLAPVRPSGPGGAGAILRLVRSGVATSRSELADHTGMSRSTVGNRVDALLSSGLVQEARGTASSGGRPPARLSFNREARVVLAADLDTPLSRLAVSDLAGRLLAETTEAFEPGGEERVLERVDEQFRRLLEQVDRGPDAVVGIGVGLPGPPTSSAGRAPLVSASAEWHPSTMREWFAARYAAPTLVDISVNMMALAERVLYWPDVEDLVFVRVGAGVTCGIVAGGRIHRGDQGAAGAIGHVRVPGHDDVLCRCGNTGCLEAVASGGALARHLASQGAAAADSHDVVRHVLEHDPRAVRAARHAGRNLGEAIAGLTSFFDPGVVVLGGELGEVCEHLLPGVREVMSRRARPPVTRNPRAVPSQLGVTAGVVGAAIAVAEDVLRPDAVERMLATT